MKVVLISGSPRKGQNSENIAAAGAAYFKERGIDAETVLLSENEITPCIHCDACKKADYCTHDEKVNSINESLAAADVVVVISPVYFGTLTGQLKCLLDKTLPLRRHGFKLKGTIGAALAVGGSRNGGQEITILSIHAWMLVHGMVIVGDNNHFGGTVHNPMEKDETGMATAMGTFSAVADMLERLRN
jgi:multimeric flavodoxin WrbA